LRPLRLCGEYKIGVTRLLILVNGKPKSRAAQALAPRERKVKDFDEDLQDEF